MPDSGFERTDGSDARYTIKDSGNRQEFDSGMVRDTEAGKLDWTGIFIGPMARRWAEHTTGGRTKYPDVAPGVPNWTLAAGMAEKVRFKASALRHFMQWFFGETDEDHAAAVFFNINGHEYVAEKEVASDASQEQCSHGFDACVCQRSEP